MEKYDFFIEKVLPFFKGDYRDFSSKKVDGYVLFVSQWWKKKHQAMITPEALEQLEDVNKKFLKSTKEKEEILYKSLISRWYVNGFTDSYNYCHRYDLDHPHKIDVAVFTKKLKNKDDLEEGEWYFDKFRKYTIDLGRREGTIFYNREHIPTIDNKKTATNSIPGTTFEYTFPEDVMRKLYDYYNGVIFQRISSLEEFENILSRKQHNQKLSHCLKKKELLKKILFELMRTLPKEDQENWLKDICLECGFSSDNIGKKINGSDSSSSETRETLQEIDEIFGKKKKKSK